MSHIINQRTQFDALIVFGYGRVQPRSAPSSGKLNLYGRLNALAAGMIFQACEIRRIIPTGGRTGGDDRPSEAGDQEKAGADKQVFSMTAVSLKK